jgi:hypothetical protein
MVQARCWARLNHFRNQYAQFTSIMGNYLIRTKETLLKYLPMFLLLVFLTAACTPAATPAATLAPIPTPIVTFPALSTPTDQPTTQEINLELLHNFTYKLESSAGLQVTLVDGNFTVNDPAQNLAASGRLVNAALGDLNGDGVTDAAVTLAANFGGSGTFHELVVVLSQDGKAVQAADLFLEDRLGEKQLTITDGLIILEMVRHGPNDPLCCPTENAVAVYRYQAGQLVVVSDQVLSSAPNIQVTRYPNQITLDSPQPGAVVGQSLLLRGKTTQMPFEKNLVVRLYDSSANRLVLELPLAVEGEYGDPGSFEINITLPAGLTGPVHLEVVDIDASNGQPRGLASVAFIIQ